MAEEALQNGKTMQEFREELRTYLEANGGAVLPDSRLDLIFRQTIGTARSIGRYEQMTDPQVLDIYPYATTSPVYVELPGGMPAAPDDARYFVAWLDRVIADAGAREDFRTAQERDMVLAYLRKARARYASLIVVRR